MDPLEKTKDREKCPDLIQIPHPLCFLHSRHPMNSVLSLAATIWLAVVRPFVHNPRDLLNAQLACRKWRLDLEPTRKEIKKQFSFLQRHIWAFSSIQSNISCRMLGSSLYRLQTLQTPAFRRSLDTFRQTFRSLTILSCEWGYLKHHAAFVLLSPVRPNIAQVDLFVEAKKDGRFFVVYRRTRQSSFKAALNNTWDQGTHRTLRVLQNPHGNLISLTQQKTNTTLSSRRRNAPGGQRHRLSAHRGYLESPVCTVPTRTLLLQTT